jgi:hypothetical protein
MVANEAPGDARKAGKQAVLRQSLAVGSSTGEPLHVLSFLEQPSPLWQTDVGAAWESLSASLSLLLRLIGRDPDPTRSRDHVVLSILAERRLRVGQAADVASLLEDVRTPPLETLGAFGVGVLVATQNPMDYRVLSNAGAWWIGRLRRTQTGSAWSKPWPAKAGQTGRSPRSWTR